MSAILLLNSILDKVRGALEDDRAAIKAYLFGSMARGDYHLWSDVDILVISEDPRRTKKALRKVLDDIFVEHNVTVAAVIIDKRSWEKGLSLLKETAVKEGRLIWKRG